MLLWEHRQFGFIITCFNTIHHKLTPNVSDKSKSKGYMLEFHVSLSFPILPHNSSNTKILQQNIQLKTHIQIQSLQLMKRTQLVLLFMLFSTVLSRNLQSVYDVIIIGAGSAGIAASLVLAGKNVSHIILQARGRFGGRTFATTVGGINVDLGASFVHNPEANNSIDAYVKLMEWNTSLAYFNQAQVFYQLSSTITDADKLKAKKIFTNFIKYSASQVANGTDMSLQDCWDKYVISIAASNYTTEAINRAYFNVYLQGNLNGADLNTVSTIAYASTSVKSNNDYLPGSSYAALIQAIYNTYCKNATIIYNQAVNSIDYSGSLVKITTQGNQIYYANRVVNTIPLGVLQSGAVTFTPQLPAAYQTALSSIGVGVFNKIIVTLNTTFWTDSTRVGDLAFPVGMTINYPEFYVAPTNPKLLLFFISGNGSKTLNLKSDAQIIADLQTAINLYTNNPVKVTGYKITRWEQQAYSKGSYSYYKVGTKSDHFKTLMDNLDKKLWFAGEHVHPNQSSNVHGAFQTGLWAGQSIVALAGVWQIFSALGLIAVVLMA